jgi:hypothetical protein
MVLKVELHCLQVVFVRTSRRLRDSKKLFLLNFEVLGRREGGGSHSLDGQDFGLRRLRVIGRMGACGRGDKGRNPGRAQLPGLRVA